MRYKYFIFLLAVLAAGCWPKEYFPNKIEITGMRAVWVENRDEDAMGCTFLHRARQLPLQGRLGIVLEVDLRYVCDSTKDSYMTRSLTRPKGTSGLLDQIDTAAAYLVEDSAQGPLPRNWFADGAVACVEMEEDSLLPLKPWDAPVVWDAAFPSLDRLVQELNDPISVSRFPDPLACMHTIFWLDSLTAQEITSDSNGIRIEFLMESGARFEVELPSLPSSSAGTEM